VTTLEKETGDSLQNIAERLNALEDSVAKLQAGLLAVKAMLALHMNSSAPKQVLTQLRSLEDTIMKRDPNAAARKEFSEVIEMLNILEKHGGPKQA
jgi:hypothetical protein